MVTKLTTQGYMFKVDPKTPIDFVFMTNDFWMQSAYLDWKRQPSITERLDEPTTLKILDIVRGKRNLSDQTKDFREACMKIRDGYVSERAARVSAEQRAMKLLDDLSCGNFDAMEFFWKNIKANSMSSKNIGKVNKKIKKYGRMLGQMLYDFNDVPTGLWTVDALRNLVIGTDTKDNTHEHYMSLHANAGPAMLIDALGKDVQFDMDDFCLLIFKNIQTIRTTCKENMNLSTYHKNNPMTCPQTSYAGARVSQLVHVGKISRSRAVWDVIFEGFPRVNQADAEAPFDNVLTLEQAIEAYPELSELRNHKF